MNAPLQLRSAHMLWPTYILTPNREFISWVQRLASDDVPLRLRITTLAEMNKQNIIPDLHVKFGERTWNETFQFVRRCMDKSRDKSKPCEPLIRCLERLQALNVFSLNAMMSHLEKIARQQGMGFHFSEATCYLTADLFYLEVVLSSQGGVRDVKVAPHGEPPMSAQQRLSLPLGTRTTILIGRVKNFVEFSKRLEGFAALYNIPGDDCEVKIKLFTSLQYLGRDLRTISHLPRSLKEFNPQVDKILNGRTGSLTEGKADCPLTIQFYVSPTDVLKMSRSDVSGIEHVGHSAQVMVGLSDVTHSLQMASVIPVPPQLDPQGDPVFRPLSEIPSEHFQACFLLRLRPPMPTFSSLLNKISQITDVTIPGVDLQWAPFHKILMKSFLDPKSCDETLAQTDHVFKVLLPGGVTHRYVFPAAEWGVPALRATALGSVPFAHPGPVPGLLELLRHQCAINTLLASCVSSQLAMTSSGGDLVFEVIMQSDSSLSVTFQRPDIDSLAILLVEVVDSRQPHCSLFPAGELPLDEYASRVMKRCMSIPVTMRALCGKMEKMSSLLAPPPDRLHAETGSDCPAPSPLLSSRLCHTETPPVSMSEGLAISAAGISHDAPGPEDSHAAASSAAYGSGPAMSPERATEMSPGPQTVNTAACVTVGVYVPPLDRH